MSVVGSLTNVSVCPPGGEEGNMGGWRNREGKYPGRIGRILFLSPEVSGAACGQGDMERRALVTN